MLKIKCLVCILSCAVASNMAQAIGIVRDGTPAAIIVLPADSQTIYDEAADELKQHVQLITGAELAIVKETEIPQDAPAGRIHIGRTQAAADVGLDAEQLEPESFIIRATGDHLYLFGDDELDSGSGLNGRVRAGTLMAVYDLLDREMGVRWLWPGPLGTVVSKRSTLTIDNVDRVSKPAFIASIFRSTAHRPSVRTAAGAMSNAALELYGSQENRWLARHHFRETISLQYGHAFEEYWERFGQSHPNYFQLNANGSRGPDSRNPGGLGGYVSMCVSNPELHRQIVDDWIKRVRYEPETEWVNCAENDTRGLCLCEVCASWDGPDADSVSDRYARFYLAVQKEAEKHDPNATIVAYAYANYTQPPVQTKLNDRVRVWVVPPVIWPWNDSSRKTFRDQWQGWRDAGVTLILRPNFTLDGHSYPTYYAESLGDAMKFAYENGMVGMDFDSNTGQWANHGPNLYMLARLNQRPDLTVKQVLDEYYAAFGSAEGTVRDYFKFWEDVRRQTAETWTTTLSHWDPEKPTIKTKWLENLPHSFYLGAHTIFTPERFDAAARLLDDAVAAAGLDEVTVQRVEFLRKGLEHARLNADVSAQFQIAQETGDTASYLVALSRLDAYRQSIETDFVSNFSYLAYLENMSWDRALLKEFEGRTLILPLPAEWEFALDPMDVGVQQDWQRSFATVERRSIRTDQAWEPQLGEPYDGVAWYRTTFQLTAEDTSRPLAILFGAVDESAEIYLNGELIHQREFRQPDDWTTPFTVNIDPSLLRKDQDNSLVVRVHDGAGAGGIWKPVWIVAKEKP